MEMRHKKIECRRVLERAAPSSKLKCAYRVSPYIGCSSGCLYCSNSTIKIHGSEKTYSQEHLQVNINAPEILKTELKRAKPGLVCISGYQPLERDQRIIRQILDILAARAAPVHIISRSDVLLDDIDIVERIAHNNYCSVTLCINTMDRGISDIFEPGTPPPKVRMDALENLRKTGITAGVAIMPVLPYISDSEEQLEELIGGAAEKKANYVLSDTLRLEDAYRASVIHALKRHYPEALVKYRRLYEFGAAPESRYVRHLKARIRALLVKYDLAGDFPFKEIDRKSEQVKLEKF